MLVYCTLARGQYYSLTLPAGLAVLLHSRSRTVCVPRNPPSGRVLEKAGLTAEGLPRGCCRKGEAFEDVIMYAIPRDDAEQANDLH